MGKARSPNRDKAFEIYKEHDGNITLREIAKILDVPEKSISGWKVKDKWNDKLNGVLQINERSTPLKNNKKKSNKSSNKTTLSSVCVTEKLDESQIKKPTQPQKVVLLKVIKMPLEIKVV